MFNKQPFNKGKFNTSSVEGGSLFGEINISLNLSGKLSVVRAMGGKADILLNTGGSVIRAQALKGNPSIELSASNKLLVRSRQLEGTSNINVETQSEGFNTYEYEVMKFSGLVLTPGDELIIDTGEMTVELNGQNVIQYFSRDSDFFSIKPGENIVVYESGNTNNKADVKILWKDAFL